MFEYSTKANSETRVLICLFKVKLVASFGLSSGLLGTCRGLALLQRLLIWHMFSNHRRLNIIKGD